MNRNKWIVTMLVGIGTLAIAIGPAWSQARPGEGQSDPSSPGSLQSPGQGGGQGSQDIRGGRGQESPTGQPGEGREIKVGRESLDKEKVKKIQEALKDKGHDPGPADGVLGPMTQQALREFQTASGLKATGRIDAVTAQALGVEGSMSGSSRGSGKGVSEGGVSKEEDSGGASSSKKEAPASPGSSGGSFGGSSGSR
ncbi:MAG: peptidoglycan-binding domain-containing protein [Candidatus Binatia bacterium]